MTFYLSTHATILFKYASFENERINERVQKGGIKSRRSSLHVVECPDASLKHFTNEPKTHIQALYNA